MSAPSTYDPTSIPAFMSPSRCVLLEINGDVGIEVVSASTPRKRAKDCDMTQYEREREVGVRAATALRSRAMGVDLKSQRDS